MVTIKEQKNEEWRTTRRIENMRIRKCGRAGKEDNICTGEQERNTNYNTKIMKTG
jgi:hypothetical protein